jgi:hypothetical protein
MMPTDPYPDNTPRQILEREYLVFTDETFLSQESQIYYPFTLWKEIDTVKHYLKAFRYMRGTMNVRFQIVTNPLQYGLNGVSVLPYMKEELLPADEPYTTQAQRAQANMVLGDLTEQTAFMIELPYNRPETYFDLSTTDNRFWRVDFTNFFLGTAGSNLETPSFSLSMYVSFSDITLAGYVPFAQYQMMTGVGQRLDLVGNTKKALAGGITFMSGAAWKSLAAGANTAIDQNTAVLQGFSRR